MTKPKDENHDIGIKFLFVPVKNVPLQQYKTALTAHSNHLSTSLTQ
jgi:hypothetical protein